MYYVLRMHMCSGAVLRRMMWAELVFLEALQKMSSEGSLADNLTLLTAASVSKWTTSEQAQEYIPGAPE